MQTKRERDGGRESCGHHRSTYDSIYEMNCCFEAIESLNAAAMWVGLLGLFVGRHSRFAFFYFFSQNNSSFRTFLNKTAASDSNRWVQTRKKKNRTRSLLFRRDGLFYIILGLVFVVCACDWNDSGSDPKNLGWIHEPNAAQAYVCGGGGGVAIVSSQKFHRFHFILFVDLVNPRDK